MIPQILFLNQPRMTSHVCLELNPSDEVTLYLDQSDDVMFCFDFCQLSKTVVQGFPSMFPKMRKRTIKMMMKIERPKIPSRELTKSKINLKTNSKVHFLLFFSFIKIKLVV